ncbi:unnamed protein product, partial [Urochloa humidicola]
PPSPRPTRASARPARAAARREGRGEGLATARVGRLPGRPRGGRRERAVGSPTPCAPTQALAEDDGDEMREDTDDAGRTGGTTAPGAAVPEAVEMLLIDFLRSSSYFVAS